jgi:nicotinamidase-related amidase
MTPENAVFVLVDVQGKLAQLMHEKEPLFENLKRLIRGMQILDIPILWIEQTPDKMGRTIPELAELLTGLKPIPKTSFGGWGEPAFREAIKALNRKHVILAGIETHVCVCQTALALIENAYRVDVVVDACSSRAPGNKKIGLQRMWQAGASPTSVETVLFQLLGNANHPKFREVLALVR